MQPRSFFFLRVKIMIVAMKLTSEPKITSNGINDPNIMPLTAFPTRQPSVAPQIKGHPNSAAKGNRQSATLSWMGPDDIGARKIKSTAYRLAKTAVRLTVLASTLSSPPTPGFVWRNGWR